MNGTLIKVIAFPTILNSFYDLRLVCSPKSLKCRSCSNAAILSWRIGSGTSILAQPKIIHKVVTRTVFNPCVLF